MLRTLDGVGEVLVDEDTGAVKAQLGTTDPAVAVRTLVTGGVAVSSASRSTRLEDVFLELVHDDTASGDRPEPTTTSGARA